MDLVRIKRILKGMICDKKKRFLYLSELGFYNQMSDVEYIKKRFSVLMGYELDLENPRTFNEKLQWLKLYNRNPRYTRLVDKYEVKKYVAEVLGASYVIPTLGVWDNFEDIDFDTLPNQFVLKCTHDSGGLVIVKDKKKLDRKSAQKKISRCLKKNYYYIGREWPYKNVKPRIIAEKYMEDTTTGELRDYKFFAFNGKVKALFVASERQMSGEETKFDFFDREFHHLDIINGHPNSNGQIEKPLQFDDMLIFAERLSENIPHVRVDFYEVDGKIYFGEFTFSHYSGFVPFEPATWDAVFGDWIELPQ